MAEWLGLLLVAASAGPVLAAQLPPGPERSQARLERNLEDERRLEAFDINGASATLELMGELEGTTMMLRVVGSDGRPVGVFKPTNGSTYHRAELAAYRLAKRLGLAIYPATVEKALDARSLEVFRRLLQAEKFPIGADDPATGHFRQKERNREAMLESLAGVERLEGVFKAWVAPLIFYYDLGTVETILRHPIYEHLKAGGVPPPDDWIDIGQCTKHFEPKGCLEAKINRRDLAKQFTGILLLDALLGNRDRFAGGNLHLRSRSGGLLELGDDKYVLPFPELLSLDNGASLQADHGFGLRMLIEELRIARFSRAHRDALAKLAEEIKTDPAAVMKSLGLEESYVRGQTYEPMSMLTQNLSELLAYLERLETGLGDAAFF